MRRKIAIIGALLLLAVICTSGSLFFEYNSAVCFHGHGFPFTIYERSDRDAPELPPPAESGVVVETFCNYYAGTTNVYYAMALWNIVSWFIGLTIVYWLYRLIHRIFLKFENPKKMFIYAALVSAALTLASITINYGWPISMIRIGSFTSNEYDFWGTILQAVGNILFWFFLTSIALWSVSAVRSKSVKGRADTNKLNGQSSDFRQS